jgi:hypothetical protein
MKDAITQAVKDGRITQAQADWLLQGLEKGYLPAGRGFGHGRGFGKFGPGKAPSQTPATPTPGSTS